MSAKLSFVCFMALIFMLRAFTIQGRHEECVSQSCTTQAESCDNECSNVLYGCWDKCKTHSCAAICIGGSENAAAVDVWNCALKKGCSPFTNQTDTTQPIPTRSDAIQQGRNKHVTIHRGNLQEFRDYTGSTFGTAQLTALRSIINKAAGFYRADLQNNTQYIKTNMDAGFYESGYQYNVVIQFPAVRDFGGYTIYCDNGTNFASLTVGTSLINPAWSYLVYRLYVYPGAAYNYLVNLGRGSGLTAAQGTQIAQVILGFDGDSACDCTNTYDILLRLQNVIRTNWNVLCESSAYSSVYSNTAVYAQIANSTWINSNFSPAKCFYFIYAID